MSLSQIIQLNVMQTVAFLNKFDNTMRERLADLGARLNRLERAVDVCEAARRNK